MWPTYLIKQHENRQLEFEGHLKPLNPLRPLSLPNCAFYFLFDQMVNVKGDVLYFCYGILAKSCKSSVVAYFLANHSWEYSCTRFGPSFYFYGNERWRQKGMIGEAAGRGKIEKLTGFSPVLLVGILKEWSQCNTVTTMKL